jgi:hypothetical protein
MSISITFGKEHNCEDWIKTVKDVIKFYKNDFKKTKQFFAKAAFKEFVIETKRDFLREEIEHMTDEIKKAVALANIDTDALTYFRIVEMQIHTYITTISRTPYIMLSETEHIAAESRIIVILDTILSSDHPLNINKLRELISKSYTKNELIDCIFMMINMRRIKNHKELIELFTNELKEEIIPPAAPPAKRAAPSAP